MGILLWFKSAEATCVKIATKMKNVLDWKKDPISIFSEIFGPYKHILEALFTKQETNFPH